MKTEYIKRSDVRDVLSRYYKEVAQYSPRQERMLVLIKNDLMALPSVEASGTWISVTDTDYMGGGYEQCAQCGQKWDWAVDVSGWRCCPVCGDEKSNYNTEG